MIKKQDDERECEEKEDVVKVEVADVDVEVDVELDNYFPYGNGDCYGDVVKVESSN